ncbi:MAG TPA: RidA family protein [Phycisphaerae bacterium]|jgi:enamine deaminase RidA (YjgF/YER057c/UK114 family)
MTDITRIEPTQRLSRLVVHNGVAYMTGVTAQDGMLDIQGQTRQVLERIDGHLAKAGIDKTRLLSVQIWLKDIERDFAGMNEVWDAWVPKGAGPARATGESKLAHPDLLVEILVTAAV